MADSTSGIQVKDNRMFNADGSLREGIHIEATSAPSAKPPSQTPPAAAKASPTQNAEIKKSPTVEGYKAASDAIDFPTFLLSLAQGAQISLGMVPHPASGQPEPDLDHARQTIDIIGLLEEKTQGNLSPEESGLLRQVLFQLRMQYVEISKQLQRAVK